MANLSVSKVFLGLLVVFLLGAAGWGMRDVFLGFQKNTDTSSADSAAEFQRSNIRATESVDRLSKELLGAQPGGEEALIKRRLAESMLLIDLTQGFALLRELVQETSYPAFDRALAVEHMATVYFERSNNSTAWARKILFADEPYASMYDATQPEDKAVWNALRALSEYALGTYAGLPISEYRIATWYVRAGDLAEAQKHVDRGDAALVKFVADISSRDVEQIVRVYGIQGQILSELSKAMGDQSLDKRAREAFDQGRTVALNASPLRNTGVAATLLWLNLRYAGLLDSSTNTEDITLKKELLKEIVKYNKVHFRFNSYLIRLEEGSALPASLPGDRALMIRLAGAESDFAAMLKGLGWKI